MLRHIPGFILHQYEQRQLSGSFAGFVLFFDIADFTPIGTQLQKHGKEGAEELSRFLDFVFGEPIRMVESWGGFVSLFAGDAFCAIFPEGGAQGAAHSIREFFGDKNTYHCELGEFSLRIRQTVSYGEIYWQIFENDLQNEYVFFGEPMRIMAELTALKEELVFSAEAAAKLGMESFEPVTKEAVIIGYRPIYQASTSRLPSLRSECIPMANSAAFLNPRYQELHPQNEIRSGAFCFANLEAIPIEQRASAIATIQTLADRYGGFVNKYDATDKGLTALILFGLPVSEGKTLERICSFALEAVEALPALALGISCGSVYAGYAGSDTTREYTALGAALNLASRLMSKARPGEVLTDSFLWQELHASYDFGYLGSLSLKGIEQPLRYYRLKRLAPNQSNREENRFVGRDPEINQIREIVDQALNSHENIILYVSGDAGIGKSRLVSEALAPYFKYNLSCDAILRKPLEAIKQMLRAHFYYNPSLPIEAAIPMFRALWSQIGSGEAETRRIESIIASLLGYEWEGSVWSMLPPEERPNQLRNAFLHFMEKLCQNKPILIHLDDGQWLDDESRSYLQALSEAETGPVIIISACRYLDDGNKAEIGLPKHQRFDLELDSLSDEGSRELIKHILRLNEVPDPTLDLIYGRSMGNPLFIEQLSSYLLETGSIDAKGGIVKELDYLSSFSISDIVSSRIDRLTDQVRECMFSASVLGMEFNIKVLSQMLKSDLVQELEAGTQNRIWKDLDKLRYIFSHILIKDIVYQRMMSDKLKELHKLAAEAMEIVYKDKLDENAEEIALHYEKAGVEMEAAEYYNKSGNWLRKRYDFDKSHVYLNKALQIREKVLGAEHPDTATSLNNLATLYDEQGKYEQAEPLHLRALEIYEKILGAEHPDTATSLNDLAGLYESQGKYEQSEALYLRALEIWEKVLGAEHPDTAESLNDLAVLYLSQGKYEQAEPLHLRALEIWEKVLGAEHPLTATSLNNLAVLYESQGKYEQAEPLCLRALEIWEKVLGAEHPDTASSLNNLADLYYHQGKYEQAEPLYLRALEIREKVLGPEHPLTATSLNNLAYLYGSQGKYEQAEALFQRALEIREKVLGAEHPDTASSLNNLAVLYKSQGKYEQAEPMNLRALEIREKVLGAEHPNTARVMFHLGNLYKVTGRLSQAEPLLLRALDIFLKTNGIKHQWTIEAITGLVDLYYKLNEPARAVHYKAMLPTENAPE